MLVNTKPGSQSNVWVLMSTFYAGKFKTWKESNRMKPTVVPGAHPLDEALTLVLAELLERVVRGNTDPLEHVHLVARVGSANRLHDALLR